ncbi:thiamine biosynthesis protein ThiI [Paenibacillus sp. UNCCL117]|uniref:tRNA uracil 4-sulfurtransferase ThiI n=1 Tax=unclassified Paenibacillus TaxID=185978 RepID=UPI00087E3EB5|nr:MULTISPECIES: tRNA uracil 4-sulfurtransferase ThiI [unclassified Paenibacillus]SDC73070.1 thiamine biosynthesis protein ThiI [Paenibacillus sp. cl123]SFW24934.1 thiamine biosynthesis protein ThiI [Paenibacillus sp. UNCCL117]
MKTETAALAILRYGELVLKGKNRHRFEKTVYEQVKRALRPFTSIAYEREFGRIVLHLNGAPYEEALVPLQRIFGLASISPAVAVPLELSRIEEAAAAMMQELEPAPRTFKVTVRRVNKRFPHDSQAMNRILGGAVLRAMPSLGVNVHAPDAELKVELREQGAWLYVRTDSGAGGFPYGSNGKGMLMLSGGIDSPVAGYLAMRQGLRIEAVHFHSYPYTSEKSQQKVRDLAGRLAGFSGSVRLHMVPFTEVQTRIHAAYADNLLITLLRRAMYRITEKLAEASGAGAIVTGESLGQVASQTLPSLDAIGRAVELPILRPLICMEKKDIIRIAESIDTFELSILPYEDCCTLFLPPSPSTNPNLNVLRRIESNMPWLDEAIADAAERTESVWIETDHAVKDRFAAFF